MTDERDRAPLMADADLAAPPPPADAASTPAPGPDASAPRSDASAPRSDASAPRPQEASLVTSPDADETDRLLGLIDRLEDLLDRSDLSEIEVQAGSLGIVLRKPGQLLTVMEAQAATDAAETQGRAGEAGRRGEGRGADGRAERERAGQSGRAGQAAGAGGSGAGASGGSGAGAPGGSAVDEQRIDGHAVVAPLTGIFYSAPSPGAAPYVTVGAEVVAGQVIGLIEAMKLFNEIKSDAAGRVVRMLAADGSLVRAKQPLVEIETS